MNPVYYRSRFLVIPFILLVSWGILAVGQDSGKKKDSKDSKAQDASQSQPDQDQDPLKRAVKPEQQKKAILEKESGYYKKWVNEDVRWIITDEELSAWKKLTTNTERDNFIEGFWQRRDPTPDTGENEYKDEHYRRIAWANEHFAAGVPGWRTDRGRMYIMYGKPDSIDSHPMGGPYQRPAEEGGGQTETYPFEVWRYRYLEGIGQEIEIEFVDPCSCGEYHMTLDRSEKDALLHVPNAGLTDMESMGMANKADRFRNPEALGQGFFNQNNQTKQFDRLETFAKLNRAPEVKFKDLEAVVNTKIRYNLLPFDVRVDFVKVTSDTVLVPITIQVPNRELTFVNKDGVQRGVLNIFGRMTTLTGKVAQTFEDPVRLDVPPELLSKFVNNVALYWKALPMRPGHYRLDIVVKDVNGDKLGTMSQSVIVPEFNEDKLASSTLILADDVEQVPSREVGTGNFVLGMMKVRPRVAPANGKPANFKRASDQKVNFWMQVYNLTLDEKTKKPSATVQYQIVNTATNKSVVDITENTDQMGNVGEQLTLQKSLPLSKLDPGVYQVTIKINDLVSQQTISPTARFTVE
ncbi:MAG TPA: GWxTD domain-containing protein [Candidatus Angelobacter sp.]|nr:GWxTD domain-containing protein [Candidatus Angelobacter sp.]